jgi:hypothetical protein
MSAGGLANSGFWGAAGKAAAAPLLREASTLAQAQIKNTPHSFIRNLTHRHW